MASEMLITRDEALYGLPAGRAAALLYAIENRTAFLAEQSKQATRIFLNEAAAEDRNLAYVTSFALGKAPLTRPSIYELEQFSGQWAQLVPDNPRICAAAAKLLGERYLLTFADMPGIRASLGLDDPAVGRAFQQMYHTPIDSIYTTRRSPLHWFRAGWARLARLPDTMPPFWTAFALTLTETVGAGILALPIALAGVGPLAGLIVLGVLGLVNVLTIAAMSESVVRNGSVRFGNAFIGRVVADYLGTAGSVILSLGTFVLLVLVVQAFYVGLSTTLAALTPVPPHLWLAVIFLIGLYFTSRESLNSTIASALMIGAINIVLILIMTGLAFSHIESANLAYVNVPFVNGRPFDPSILELIFGLVLAAYFGHLSVSSCGRMVLARDPGGKSLIWGAVAAQIVAMLLYGLWVIAVNGAVSPETMAAETGTALAPLTREVGPAVGVLGAIFALLGMGMTSIHYSLGLFNLVRERLPRQTEPVVLLPRMRGKLTFRRRGLGRDELAITLTYLGTQREQHTFEVHAHGEDIDLRETILSATDWRSTDIPALVDVRGVDLAFKILDATRDAIRLKISTTMRLTYTGEWDNSGLRLADVLTMPKSISKLVAWLIRQGEVTPAQVVEHTGLDEETVEGMLDDLADHNFIQREVVKGAPIYSAHLAPRRTSRLPKELLEQVARVRVTSPGIQRSGGLTLGKTARTLLSFIPVVLIFLYSEWLLFTGAESFSGPLGLIGVIVIPMLGGIFPILMVSSARRKGEFIPQGAIGLLGWRAVAVLIYLVFLAAPLLHGLVIWQDPPRQAAALISSLVMVGLTVWMLRGKSFSPRVVVELRHDRRKSGRDIFAVTASGKPAIADVRLVYGGKKERKVSAAGGVVQDFTKLERAIFRLPAFAGPVHDVKIWMHSVDDEGDSVGLAGEVEVRFGDQATHHKLGPDGQIVIPLKAGGCEVEIIRAE